MKTYTYPAIFEPGQDAGIVVSFPDVPEAITQGDDMADARAMAAEALGVALLSYFSVEQQLPKPSPIGQSQVAITADPDMSVKIAVLEVFRESSISRLELARRLGKDDREVRRILDPNHPTKLPTLMAALAVLGQRLVIGIEAA